jgi:ribose 5-phosphate isomerase B
VTSDSAQALIGRGRIAVAADAAGRELKDRLAQHLREIGVDVADLGTNGSDPVHYPDFAQTVGDAVVTGECVAGILVCGTGIGMSIAANKIPGIRAALCHDTFGASKSRGHNDANVLALGAWDVTPERAQDIVDVWIGKGYDGGRHDARLEKLEALDETRTVPAQ